MFRFALALVVIASIEAGRVTVHRYDVSESKAKWGASCDHLQTTFRNRVVAFQTFLDANPDLDAVSRAAQIRVMMRTYGIIRPLRRARECSWVVDNDSEEIEQARNIVQILLAGNPCAEAARSELEVGTTAVTPQDEIQSVQRAVSVLSSETCEVGELPEQTETLDEENVDSEISNAEDGLQDAIDELESSVPEGAFIQTESSTAGVVGFMRGLAVAFLMILLLLACVTLVFAIGFFIAGLLTYLMVVFSIRGSTDPSAGAIGIIIPFAALYGGMGAGVLGLAGCAYQLYTQLLPRLQ
jgi:hypothetical protein